MDEISPHTSVTSESAFFHILPDNFQTVFMQQYRVVQSAWYENTMTLRVCGINTVFFFTVLTNVKQMQYCTGLPKSSLARCYSSLETQT